MATENASPATAARPKRRRPRLIFVVFGLVVGVYVAAQFFPGLRPMLPDGSQPGPGDERMLAEIRRLGGQTMKNGTTPGLMGFGMRPLYFVELRSAEIDDDTLGRLAPLMGGRVTSLRMYETRVTDTGLAHLAGLDGLKTLDLKGPRVTRAASGDAPESRRITGAGLAKLGSIPTLVTLELGNADLVDDDLAGIRAIPQLKVLFLDGNRVRGPGLAHLKGSGIHMLTLDLCPIDDAGLDHLNGLPQLGYLSLGGTEVTTAGLLRLKNRFPRLSEVRLLGSGFLPPDLKPLRAAMPQVRFYLD